MKNLLFALPLFASPLFVKEYTIYTTQRLPFLWAGIFDSEGYYQFTNTGDAKCDIYHQGCWIKSNEKTVIINKVIIKAKGRYFCSEKYIKIVNKAKPNLSPLRYSSVDLGYGKCTKDGWVR